MEEFAALENSIKLAEAKLDALAKGLDVDKDGKTTSLQERLDGMFTCCCILLYCIVPYVCYVLVLAVM